MHPAFSLVWCLSFRIFDPPNTHMYFGDLATFLLFCPKQYVKIEDLSIKLSSLNTFKLKHLNSHNLNEILAGFI